MRGHADVIVIGLGAMGASCAAALAARGVSVLGLERFDLPHDRGSSGGQTRLVRMAYFEHPDYVPLLREAYAGWDRLADDVGTTLFHRTGLFYLGRPDGPLLEGTLRAAREHGLVVDEVDAAAQAERFPAFLRPDGFAAYVEPDAGFVLCERAIAAWVDLARARGAQLHGRERVMAIITTDEGVTVETDRDRYSAGHVVVSAGAWTSQLLDDLGVPLRVTGQALGWVAPQNGPAFELGRFPCWAVEDDAPGFSGLYYGFPALPARFDGPRGLKLAHHLAGPDVDPDAWDRQATLDDEATFRPVLRRFLPTADGPTLAAKRCLYTLTPDEHFIVDGHPRRPCLTVAAGFSGHGFKFAPAIGEALADLALEGRTGLPIGLFALSRFGTPAATPG